MFRINDGKINIFGRNVGTLPGTHTISVDTESGAVYTDSSIGTDVVQYTLLEGGHIQISSLMTNEGRIGKQPVKALDMNGGSIVSKGPFYESANVLTSYLEGFLLSFNYYALANIVSALAPFTWAGGRVCFTTMYTPGAINPQYTAMPSSGRCGNALSNMYDSGEGQVRDIAAIYGGGGGGFMAAASNESMQFYANATSVVFSYRTHRKYVFFASNVDGLFESPIGSIGGSADSSPPNGAIPDPGDINFKFSMHSLRQ